MIEEISRKIKIAKRDMKCHASEWFMLYTGGLKSEFLVKEEDKAALEKSLNENGKILKGQEYIEIKTKIDGVTEIYRSRLNMQTAWENFSKLLAYKPK